MKKRKFNWKKIRLKLAIAVTIYLIMLIILIAFTINTVWHTTVIWMLIIGYIIYLSIIIIELICNKIRSKKMQGNNK